MPPARRIFFLRSNGAFVDQARQNAQRRQIFERHLLRPFTKVVSRGIPNRKEAPQSELQTSPLATLHSLISRIACDAQARLSWSSR